jgi:hypothetical protein
MDHRRWTCRHDYAAVRLVRERCQSALDSTGVGRIDHAQLHPDDGAMVWIAANWPIPAALEGRERRLVSDWGQGRNLVLDKTVNVLRHAKLLSQSAICCIAATAGLIVLWPSLLGHSSSKPPPTLPTRNLFFGAAIINIG